MKVHAPNDLQGRLIRCEQRAKMIGDGLEAIAHSDYTEPDADALGGFAAAALELVDELKAIGEAYAAEDPPSAAVLRMFGVEEGDA
jgi:hypothetical protein